MTQKPLSSQHNSIISRRGSGQTIECWECGSLHQIASGISEFTCPNCNHTITLKDIVITDQRVRRIETQGELRILSGAFLVAGNSTCRDLRLMGGSFSGNIHVSGEARLERGEIDLSGEIHCKHFSVNAKTSFKTKQPVRCQSAQIDGFFLGDLICSGTIHLSARGHLSGTCQAKSFVMEPGSITDASMRLTGHSRKKDSTSQTPAPKKRLHSEHSYQQKLPKPYYQSCLPKSV